MGETCARKLRRCGSRVENGSGTLPVGKYRINQWILEHEDKKGRKWKLQGESASDKGDFNITTDNETKLSIGEPIVSKLQVNKRDSGYSFNQNLEGKFGERARDLARESAEQGELLVEWL